MNEHEQIHTSEKPFSCSQCEEKFENANGLKEHEMTHSSRLRVMSWNINRGISNSTKMAQILNTISEEEVDIMFLLETYDEEKNIASVTLPGFITVPGKPSIHDGKVRIMAFVSENLPFSHRKDLSSADTSTLWLEIERENKANYLIGGCYREWGSADLSSPKNISEDHQLARLQNITKTLQTATSEKKDLVFLGDINFDMKKWN